MNRRNFVIGSGSLLLASSALSVLSGRALAAGRPKFKFGVSIYAGWMPWYFANETGILKKWADHYGVDVDMQYMDYGASIDGYNAGSIDAIVITNMDLLDAPAAAGVDSSAIIMGDYSNGNDALLVRNHRKIQDLKGKSVMLMDKSVSQYLLERALQSVGMSGADLAASFNVADVSMTSTFLADKGRDAVVTWNPMVMEILENPGITKIFDSSKIPGEIMDLAVVNTKVLNGNPNLGRALTATWYEVMRVMSQRTTEAKAAKEKMAALCKTSLAEFEGQLTTTAMYYTPDAAAAYTKSAEIKDKMDLVRKYCFKANLLGDNAPSEDVVGISYPDGFVQGDKSNIKMRFVSTFMDAAAAGTL